MKCDYRAAGDGMGGEGGGEGRAEGRAKGGSLAAPGQSWDLGLGTRMGPSGQMVRSIASHFRRFK